MCYNGFHPKIFGINLILSVSHKEKSGAHAPVPRNNAFFLLFRDSLMTERVSSNEFEIFIPNMEQYCMKIVSMKMNLMTSFSCIYKAINRVITQYWIVINAYNLGHEDNLRS